MARRPAGIGLATVLLMAAVMLAASAALLQLTSGSFSVSRTAVASSELLQAAMAGVEEARAILSTEPDWSTAIQKIPTVPRTFDDRLPAQVMYRLEVTEVELGRCTVRSTGYMAGGGLENSVTAVLKRRNTNFLGVVGLMELKLDGESKVDRGRDHLDLPSSIITNSVLPASIRIFERASVDGDARYGPGGDGSQIVQMGDLATLTGERKPILRPMAVPPAVAYGPPTGPSQGDVTLRAGQAELPPGVYGRLTAGGGVHLQLRSGAYSFREVVLENGARVDVRTEGEIPARVFVEEDLHLHNARVNPNGSASSLILYMAGVRKPGRGIDADHVDNKIANRTDPVSQDTAMKAGFKHPVVHMHGNSHLGAALYAPEYIYEAGEGTSFHGAILGALVHMHDRTHFEFDPSVREIPDPIGIGEVIILSLQRNQG